MDNMDKISVRDPRNVTMLRTLASQSEMEVIGDDCALEYDALRTPLLLALKLVKIQHPQDLMDAERILDVLEAVGLGSSQAAEQLLSKAEDYLRRNPLLVNDKWFRSAGAVYELVQRLRAEREMRHVLARFKLKAK